MTISHIEATAAGEPAERAPFSVKERTIVSLVSKIVTSNPASIKRWTKRPPILPIPIYPTLRSDITLLLENLSSQPEAVHGGRNTAIDGDLEKHLFDVILR